MPSLPVRVAGFLLCALLAGSTYAAYRLAASELAASSIGVLQIGITLPLLAAALAVRQIRRRERPSLDVRLAGIALVSVLLDWVIPTFCWGAAASRLDSAVIALLMAAMPAVTVIMGAALRRRLPSRRTVAGVAVGFAGLALMGVGQAQGARGDPVAVALALTAVVSWAAGGFWGVRVVDRLGVLGSLVACRGLSLPMIAAGGLAIGQQVALPVTANAIAGVLWLAGPCTIGALLYWAVLRWWGPLGFALVGYIEPFVAIAIGVLLLSEQLLPAHWAAAALVLVAFLLRPMRDASPSVPPGLSAA
jgi:drug/metabolite transporter (DMT)-like permease